MCLGLEGSLSMTSPGSVACCFGDMAELSWVCVDDVSHCVK